MQHPESTLPTIVGRDQPSRPHPLMPEGLPEVTALWLTRVLEHGLVPEFHAAEFFSRAHELPEMFADPELLAETMLNNGLLTEYQLRRCREGRLHGMRFGNYRVLDQIGGPEGAEVLRAEHVHLGRTVAIKVIPVDPDATPEQFEQFRSELCALSRVAHPHVMATFDSGELEPIHPGDQPLKYLVMEMVKGGDLRQYVRRRTGLLQVAQACEWIRQAASGLQAVHDHHLTHRNLKPSNLLLTEHGQIKLIDFGLIRDLHGAAADRPESLAEAQAFMAPEQRRDPGAVSPTADIYSLGATLYWLLTGETPQSPSGEPDSPPRRVRELRADVPEELEQLLERILSLDPEQRPAVPLTVMNALARFAAPASGTWDSDVFGGRAVGSQLDSWLNSNGTYGRTWRVAVADRDPKLRQVAAECLEMLGCACVGLANGLEVLHAVQNEPFDLLILQQQLPPPDAFTICRVLRERPSVGNLKILILNPNDPSSGGGRALAQAFAEGADEMLSRPFNPLVLAAKAQHLLRLKDAQDRVAKLTDHLLASNRQLEESLLARAEDVRRTQDALLYAMAKMAESRAGETPGHLKRLQQYTRTLAEYLRSDPEWVNLIEEKFLDTLYRTVPLHDIGKIGMPDHILLKPGKLSPEERALIETHPVIGAELLEAIGHEYGDSLSFLGIARGIVRHHHEWHDGTGYPDKLAGDAIPPGARLVALADVYDALRRQLPHKPARTHLDAVDLIVRGSPGQFNPKVVKAFEACQARFEQIYQAISN